MEEKHQTDHVKSCKIFTVKLNALRLFFCLSHETININLDDKPEWFQEKNPLGQVPVLEYDDKIICESETVCAFLDEDNGRRLTPQDPDRQKDDQRLLQNYSKVCVTHERMHFYILEGMTFVPLVNST